MGLASERQLMGILRNSFLPKNPFRSGRSDAILQFLSPNIKRRTETTISCFASVETYQPFGGAKLHIDCPLRYAETSGMRARRDVPHPGGARSQLASLEPMKVTSELFRAHFAGAPAKDN